MQEHRVGAPSPSADGYYVLDVVFTCMAFFGIKKSGDHDHWHDLVKGEIYEQIRYAVVPVLPAVKRQRTSTKTELKRDRAGNRLKIECGDGSRPPGIKLENRLPIWFDSIRLQNPNN